MYELAKLGEIVEKNTGSQNPTKAPNESFIYVDVAAIDNTEKNISGARRMLRSEAPSRARKLIRTGDILVSTVRPNLNAVALVPSGLNGQVASTGFCVLRATAKVLPEYLFYFVRSREFVDGLSSLVAGAMYPAVTDSQVLDQSLPLPAIPEQRRIVDILSRTEGIVRLRRDAEKKAAELIPALFLDMFGDPSVNPKGELVLRLEDLIAENKLGLVRGSKEVFEDGQYPYLRMNSVGDGYIRTENLKRVNATAKEAVAYSLQIGDFLFNTRNSKELVGKTGIFTGAIEPCILFNNNLMRIRFKQEMILQEFANAQFQTDSVQRQLEAIKRGTTSVFAIYFKDLKNVNLIVPKLDKQRKFSEMAQSIRSVQSQQSAATTKAQATFNALLAQVFNQV